MKLENGSPVESGMHSLGETVRCLNELGKGVDIHGANVAECERIDGLAGKSPWIKLSDYIGDFLKQSEDDIEFAQFAVSDSANALISLFTYGEINKDDKEIVELHEIYEKLAKYKKKLAAASTNEAARKCLWDNLLGVAKIAPPKEELAKLIDKKLVSVYNRFPLLTVLTSAGIDKKKISGDISEYVSLKLNKGI